MESIQQTFSVPFQYQVHFTEGLFSTDNPLLTNVLPSSPLGPTKCFFVVDAGVSQAHPKLLGQIEQYFAHHAYLNLCAAPLVVPGGEEAKNDLQWLTKILDATNEFAIDRHSYILAIGGGAVLDMVGFAAAIAHRGIRHIRIPTTVLSQNDSGVGVKNSVNFFSKKNYLGTFAPPVAVINDFDFLLTLEDRDWRGGISEAIKVALIKDKPFFEEISEQATALAQRDMPSMKKLIYDCAKHHMAHIAGGDPFEMGSSRPLDFGHWSAHKLEQMTGYQLRHGEAVAIGIALDTTYSMLKGMLPEADWKKVIHTFKLLGFSLFTDEMDPEKGEPEKLFKGLDEFREHLGGQLTIMLLDAIGKGVEVHEIDCDLMEKALLQLREATKHPV